MANRWNIPPALEDEIRSRDLACIYCGVVFSSSPVAHGNRASWEHIVNDATIITRENIALCCCSCNASKGQKVLGDWLGGNYCQSRGITRESISQVAKNALQHER